MFGFVSRLLILVVLAACRNEKIEFDTQEEEPPILDSDQDGFMVDIDCDDTNPAINPDAEEICDAFDNNCNGEVDEGVGLTFYPDADGDGFGDSSAAVETCDLPPNHVGVGSDCDDNEPTTYPGAEEICDELDNDCDGEIDDDIFLGQYEDLDGDGYGNPNAPVTDCENASSTNVSNSLDCNDADPTVFTGANEICDEIDNDCDGAIDELGGDNQLWHPDGDADGFGDPSESVASCDPVPGHVQNGDDCNDLNSQQNPNAEEICNSEDDDCDGIIDLDAPNPFVHYYDADGDGFGDSNNSVESCQSPTNHVANGLDCNDSDPNISPNAMELCNQIDDDCDGAIDEQAVGSAAYYADDDGDGFGAGPVTESCTPLLNHVLNANDCDDSDPLQSPLGIEECNGEDDNCNGQIDEYAADAAIWYADTDGDGFGDIGDWQLSCTQPNGCVSSNEDCDDNNANINPMAPETCNEIDDNCNNQIDEGLPTQLWYADSDNDGFGDPTLAFEDCGAPSGLLLDNTDCDDADSNVNPGMGELCNDGIDNNCDGFTDDPSSTDAFYGYLDEDGDGYGGGPLTQSCDDVYLPNNDDCNDDDAAINPGTLESCDGIDNDCDGEIDADTICPCTFERYGDNAYLFCTQSRTWSVAKGECAQVGYHLVTVNDQQENNWIDQTRDGLSGGQWWIGLNDLTVEDYWDWDGPYANFFNWDSNYPTGGGDCVSMRGNGRWRDRNCAIDEPFVCEATP